MQSKEYTLKIEWRCPDLPLLEKQKTVNLYTVKFCCRPGPRLPGPARHPQPAWAELSPARSTQLASWWGWAGKSRLIMLSYAPVIKKWYSVEFLSMVKYIFFDTVCSRQKPTLYKIHNEYIYISR